MLATASNALLTWPARPRGSRSKARALLAIGRGDRVLVAGCGAGRDLPHLSEIVGEQGAVIGIERDGRRLASAARRTSRRAAGNVTLLQADAASAFIGTPADAALFCATPQLVRNPHAVLNVLRQLRPHARVVGLLPTRPGLITSEPWALLERYLADFDILPVTLGRAYAGYRTVPAYDVRPG